MPGKEQKVAACGSLLHANSVEKFSGGEILEHLYIKVSSVSLLSLVYAFEINSFVGGGGTCPVR